MDNKKAELLMKPLLGLAVLIIYFLLQFHSCLQDLRSNDWLYFVVIFVIAIVLVVIDEIRLRRLKLDGIELPKSFIRRWSARELFLYAILSGIGALLGILFGIIPFMSKGEVTLQRIKGNMTGFINIALIILGTIYFIRRYIKQQRAVDETGRPTHE